ncbi:MAG: COG3014 family protein [Bacteroidales bacterium]
MKKFLWWLFILPLGIAVSGCATYYQQSRVFQDNLQRGNLDEARHVLLKQEKEAQGKNRFLYWCNRGWVEYMLGNFEESIKYFNEADLYIDDLSRNYGTEALALVTNPGVKPYMPEDPEKVMVNFYKALAFLQLGRYEEALVEARRIPQKLYELNDKYKNRKNRYSDDAFAHILTGLIYDAVGDANNAFIAYRNAVRVYDSVITPQFGVAIPNQLKNDLLRTAWLTGFQDEVSFFEKKFDMKYEPKPLQGGYVVFFWENGLGPVKDEWSIMFTKVDGSGGWVTLVNEEYGMHFPVYLGNTGSKSSGGFSDLSVFRVAFPKYIQRVPYYSSAVVSDSLGTISKPLERVEDLNAILLKTLEDRMWREMATGLARLASKKALEAAVREGDKNIGALVGILNAATEKADTRNWQTLPFEISYIRLVLPEGKHSLQLRLEGVRGGREIRIPVEVKKGRTTFVNWRSLEYGGFK